MEGNHNKAICSSTSLTVHAIDDDDEQQQQLIINKKKTKEEEEEYEILKTRISSHPLYDLLVENHLNCLKVSGIGYEERALTTNQQKKEKPSTSSFLLHSDLDHFMEAYCAALSKLKEAMQEPQQESIDFVNSMHSQLRDLIDINPPSGPSSGNRSE